MEPMPTPVAPETTEPVASPKPPRIPLLDELRGFALILMIIYHTLYDLAVMYAMPIAIGQDPWLNAFQLLICCTFILVSGTSAQFSRNLAKRGIITFAVAMLLTVVTMTWLPQFTIQFGVLHMLGVSMLLFSFVKKPFSHIPPIVGLIVCFVLFLLTFELSRGYIGIPGVIRFVLPRSMYMSPYLYPIGLPHPSFWSSDYFPIFPWFFLFLCGTFIGNLAKKGKFPKFAYQSHVKPLAFLGRYSLWIYVAHQPAIYGVLWLLSNLLHLF